MPVVLLLLSCFLMCACNNTSQNGLWESATYTEDATLGTGEKNISVQVTAEGKTINFKISTDCEFLADALLEHNLISGDMQQYGLYVKVVNGITADYNIDKSYWSLTKSGEYMQTGVSQTQIADGDQYEIVYTKQ